ncbi:SOUL family heme-binding protein [Litoreibacter roseus]|uniref:SOUL heme-binding protein n=1 Tax=Litoreibacter roseus TaxID=2601869 RepID=A0A6N6JFB8_9RHOB|nr:heme-binding protein [Litoreibacter roseus]GFE64647.1 SOUL heme-binding protein [Litoreibacter roseus]
MGIEETTFAIAAGVLLSAVGAAQADTTADYKGYETPPAEVIRSAGDIELRRYAPHVVAEVRVRGSRRGAASKGFRMLAGYIFGKNETDAGDSTKIAMTAPVTQMPEGDAWDIRFMMPASYTLDTLPTAKDPAIRFFETQPETQLVLQFSGRWSDAILGEKTNDLRQFAASEGLEIVEPPIFHFYDDPFTLPWNRRNEVAFRVE